MKAIKQHWKDALIMVVTLAAAFLLNLLVQTVSASPSLIPMLFVLGVFIVSLKTQGYFWGILASLISVLAVNYAFTFPFYAIDLITPESLASAVVMLIVSLMTSSLTTKIKLQEKLKAESEKERMRANLLRAVSHDLRTPLTSIYGASATVAENYESLSKEQHLKLIGDVCEDAQWMIRMVENLLSVTRIDGEKVKIIKIPTVLEELIDTVLVKFQKRCPGQQVQLQIPEETADKLCAFGTAVVEQNAVMNLTAITEPEAVAKLHLLDSLTVLTVENLTGKTIIDVGCGAGFPGVPVAIACPEAKVTLLDSLGKRMHWLETILPQLGVNARCITARAEEAITEHREKFDFATSRAVARLNILLELTAPYVRVGGAVLALKGSAAREELEEAKGAVKKLGLKVEKIQDFTIDGATHSVIVLRKIAHTPSQYPRRFAKIKQSPL